MNLLKCVNGHFYDGDQYSLCPHCGRQPEPFNDSHPESWDTNEKESSLPKHQPATDSQPEILAATPKTECETWTLPQPCNNEHDEQKTVGFFAGTGNPEPVAGWLVCIQGKAKGRDFRIKAGRNFIGRATNMDICLSGESSVSRDRHAIFIYEPKKNIFLVQPGNSREMFYLNGEVVLTPVPVHRNDVLELGEVKLMFIPFCDDTFHWDKQSDETKSLGAE